MLRPDLAPDLQARYDAALRVLRDAGVSIAVVTVYITLQHTSTSLDALSGVYTRPYLENYLLRRFQPPAEGVFLLQEDRQQIADVLGLTIETVSRQMSALRAAQVIDLPGRRSLHILDRARLTAMAGD